MKHLIRSILNLAIAIFLTQLYIPGLVIKGNFIQTLAVGSVALFLLNTLVKPILNLFLMPINILTLGILSWLVNAITLFIVTIFVPTLVIQAFFFPGANIFGIIIPALSINTIFALVIVSLSISAINNFIHWLWG